MPCSVQYSCRAAQRYEQLEKDAAKLKALPKPESLVDAPKPMLISTACTRIDNSVTCSLQYSSQAAQRYKQQLEKDAAKLNAVPKPESLVDAPNPVPNPNAPSPTALPASTDATAAPLAAAAAPAAAANGKAAPEENGAAEKAPAGLSSLA